jgi:hypothetical protein
VFPMSRTWSVPYFEHRYGPSGIGMHVGRVHE